MGGYGSGRTSWRGVLEDCRQIDVNRWNREGLLEGTSAGSWVWRDEEGEQVASIGFRSSREVVELTYTVRPGEADEEHLSYRVPVVWTPCNYGGQRPWFICPNTRCGRRVGKLYLHGGYFVCRHCTRRSYQSQREDGCDRLLRKAWRIRSRLGASMNLSEPVWRKPKGMHWRTFGRLKDEEEWANHLSLMVMARKLGIGV